MADEIKKVVDQVKTEVTTEVITDVVQEVAKEKEEIKVEAEAWYNKLPLYGKLLVAAALVFGYLGYQKWFAAANTAPVVINVAPAAVNPPILVPVTATVDAATAAKLDTARLFAKILRHQTVKQLQTEGFKSATGDSKPLTKDQATALLDNLEDDHLVAVANIVLPTEGHFLDTIGSLLKWVLENKETIKKVIEMIIMLLTAFA